MTIPLAQQTLVTLMDHHHMHTEQQPSKISAQGGSLLDTSLWSVVAVAWKKAPKARLFVWVVCPAEHDSSAASAVAALFNDL